MLGVADFLKTLMKYGLERFNLFYGTYRGLVVSTEDPEDRGRVKVRVFSVSGKDINVWVDPSSQGAGTNRGMFWPPEKGDSVWVRFAQGKSERPWCYHGGWYGTEDVPAEFAYSNKRPERRGFVTRAGHALILVDEAGSERVRLLWHKPDDGDAALTDPSLSADRTTGKNAFLSFEADGSAQLFNANGSHVNLDASDNSLTIMDENGNSVLMNSDGITLLSKDGNSASVNAGGMTVIGKDVVNLMAPTVNVSAGGVFLGSQAASSAVLGEALISWLNTHAHGTGVGPTTPPLVPASPALLSQKVKVG